MTSCQRDAATSTTVGSGTGEGWTAPVLVDTDGSIAPRYGLTAFPYWVAVDADGRVAWRGTGELPTDALDSLVSMLTTGN